MRFLTILLSLISLVITGFSQDIIVKNNGSVLRATILGTDFKSVKYSVDDAAPVISGMKDIKEFVWNGETYIIKTFFDKKKAEDKFVRIIETGVVNLYSMGGTISTEIAPERSSSRPRFSVGVGSGGGAGLGGNINFGGNRGDVAPRPTNVKTAYFIEKPGTGAIQEVMLNNINGTKALLMQKLGDDIDLAGRIKNLEELDGKGLIAYVKAYNEGRK